MYHPTQRSVACEESTLIHSQIVILPGSLDGGTPYSGLTLRPSLRRVGEAPGPWAPALTPPAVRSALRELASSTRSREPAHDGPRG
eukprot:2181922-Pleurochrysis_carterae.AAC.2